ncbi:MAG TPA: hypothetical protein DCY79_03835 [Planctomycetaceae bacterium]|jgi:hypothetical protein|nr:hypothetical protein [Blastopirellula sp.]HAY78915.1 hypothetical protein [Planctomycetaceae bacterium]
MSRATFFVQECPTCGRSLEVRVDLLGKLVKCRHCSGRFVASDPANTSATLVSDSAILERADELLATVESMPSRPR